MGVFNLADRWLRASPWRLLGIVCIFGFLAGSLLDLDHIPAALGIKIGFVPFGISQGIRNGRFLHGVALFGGGIMCACAGGYLYWMVLKDTINKVISELKNKVYDILAS